MTRILLYTGKGGVGKTSIAAATALLCSERGHRTLVLSTDIAHSLADAFDLPMGAEPTRSPRTCGARSRTSTSTSRRYWRTIQNYVAELFSWHGLDEVMAEEMTVLPGMDELGNLLWIADHVDSGRYDVIVVDAAPTGETLRLLSLPEATRWWVERIAPIGRRVSRIGRTVDPEDDRRPHARGGGLPAAERLLRRLEHLHNILVDPAQTSVRMVLALEKLSIAEARRSFTYFHLFGYPSDLVVANRVLPADAGGYFAPMRAAQQRYLPEVEQEFGPVPVRTVPYFDREMVGIDRLRELGEALFGKDDPTLVLYAGGPTRSSGTALVTRSPSSFRSPRRTRSTSTRHGDELLLRVDQWRRTLLLPRALIEARTRGATMEGHTLRVEFEPRMSKPAGGKRR